MIRIRRSLLEEFRRCVSTEFGDEGRLVRTIRGEGDPPNARMLAGTAWDRCVEHNASESGGFSFDPEDVAEARSMIGPGRWKVLGSVVLGTPEGKVELTGEADHLSGFVVQDVKLTFDAPDPDLYADSLQWRAYLLMFKARVFRYVVFHAKEPDESGFVTIKSVQCFKHWTYPAIRQDVADWCGRFAEWAELKGLTPYLTPGHELYVPDRQERTPNPVE